MPHRMYNVRKDNVMKKDNLNNNKNIKKPLNVLRKSMVGLALAGIMAVSPFALAGCGSKGDPGANGKNGAMWYTGEDAPSALQGVEGDFYIDTNDYILYQKNADGVWTVVMENFGRPGDKGETGEDGTSVYVGYDGYIWNGADRTDLQLDVVDADVSETTLQLYDNKYFARYMVDASNPIAMLNNYFQTIQKTGYSGTKLTSIAVYANQAGKLEIGTAKVSDIVTSRGNGTALQTTTKVYNVNAGLNEIVFDTPISIAETDTLVLGGGTSNVSLYASKNVVASDQFGLFTTLDSAIHEELYENTNGVNDKLILRVNCQAVTTSQIDSVISDGLKNASQSALASTKAQALNMANAFFVNGDYANLKGSTVTSVEIFVQTVDASKEYSFNLFVIDATNIGSAKCNIVRTITKTVSGTELTGNSWNKIALDSPVELTETQTMAFGSSSDTLNIPYCYDNEYNATKTLYKQEGSTSYNYGVWCYIKFIGPKSETVETSFAEHVANLKAEEEHKLVQSMLAGKNISFLGDSITTFKGVTDNGNLNDTITSSYLARYAQTGDSDSSLVKLNSVNDTWWMQTADKYGMKLCVNNSWRGTKVYEDTTAYNKAGYGTRCVNLHDNTLADNLNNAVVNPDIIAVYMGTNDYLQNATLGTFSASTVDSVVVNSGAEFTYNNPSNFAEAYTIMIHKMLQKYPDADIFCFTVMPISARVNQAQMESINTIIKGVANYFNLPIVDLYANTGVTWANASEYLASDGIHPNANGITCITNCFNTALETYYKNK